MAKIVPSVLETDKVKFDDMLSREMKLPGVERIQVDFGDGKFVPNTMLAVSEIEPLNPAFHFEAHLMCEAPKDFLDYQIAGFKTIIVHFEAFQSAADLQQAILDIKDLKLTPAIALKVETPVSVLEHFKTAVNHFQLMSVHPGFQGTPFLEETYERIAALRKLCPNAILEVDGGVNETNIKKIVEAGADLIILGSAITKAPDMLEAYNKLEAAM